MTQADSNKSSQQPSFSIIALMTANLVPLIGVVFLGWDAASIVLLYWIENLIVGIFNVLRMFLVKVESRSKQFQKLFMIPFLGCTWLICLVHLLLAT